MISTHLFGFRTGRAYPSPPRAGLIMGRSFHRRRWQEVECSKQEVRMAKAKVVLGHFKWHDIQKGGFDAKKGGSVLRLQFSNVPRRERAFVPPPQSPLRLLRRAASFYFRLYVPLLLPGARPSFHLNVPLLHRRRRARLLYRRTRWDLQLLRSALIVLRGHS